MGRFPSGPSNAVGYKQVGRAGKVTHYDTLLYHVNLSGYSPFEKWFDRKFIGDSAAQLANGMMWCSSASAPAWPLILFRSQVAWGLLSVSGGCPAGNRGNKSKYRVRCPNKG